MNTLAAASDPVLFIADNLALDFINTAYGADDERVDCFTDDTSVVEWLRKAGQSPAHGQAEAAEGLLSLARQLRECLRTVVHAAMSGTSADLTIANQVLESGRPVRNIDWDQTAQAYRVTTRPRDNSPASRLAPVVESMVSLLTSDKFQFVRQCEAHDCVLLFHDLTKSHRRRWCSMATCGNRMKVAAFRSRKKGE
jgi:predicted RNA-binding Zn ribbon-like protein